MDGTKSVQSPGDGNCDVIAIRQAAASVGVDVRTLARFLKGARVRGVAGARCARAAAALASAKGAEVKP